ncbi:MAG: hypothetical protein JXJ04_21915 [Spirochaetales bacterium]|nr:hypothetical protein [Spirochaetales bacterium]
MVIQNKIFLSLLMVTTLIISLTSTVCADDTLNLQLPSPDGMTVEEKELTNTDFSLALRRVPFIGVQFILEDSKRSLKNSQIETLLYQSTEEAVSLYQSGRKLIMASWISSLIGSGCFIYATHLILQNGDNKTANILGGVGMVGLVSTIYFSMTGYSNYGKAVREYNRYLRTTYE